ncbi:hypothetical protein L1049_015341 [Liquidambar formosana]|uniref:Uncharacterized protein n=1 Tax=Liquidambar formosana TaxID=63359 RepID=A0AAP0RZD6_LIQFO
MLEAWQGYITMEIEMGHINEARSIYKRCYSKRFFGTGSEDICNSWLRFEREFGTLEDFDHAVQKVTPRLEELQLFRIQQESKGVAGSTDQKQNPNKKISREKRKPDSKATDEQPPAKRQKDRAQDLKKAYGKDKAQAQKSVESNKVEDIKAKVEIGESTTEQEIKDSTPKKTKPYTDQCTAFISNLGFQASSLNPCLSFSSLPSKGLEAHACMYSANTQRQIGINLGKIRSYDANINKFCRQILNIFVISSVMSVVSSLFEY